MPIELRELVIRARVDAGGGGGQGGTSCGRPAQRPDARNRQQGGGAADNEVVQACVREVMRILEEKRER